MSTVDHALQAQLKNIETRSGKTLGELAALIRASGLSKHGEIRDMLKRDLGMGHGDANTLVHHVLASHGSSGADEIYTGAKAALRPIHEKLMEEIGTFGEFEVAPKKGYVSLRRKKQFAMLGPATNTRFEVGLNCKSLQGGERLIAQPPKGMCDYKVKLADVSEVDAELTAWIRQAYDAAG